MRCFFNYSISYCGYLLRREGGDNFSSLSWIRVASFPGPTQLSIAFSVQKSGESLVSFLTWAWHNRKWQKFAELIGCVSNIFNQLQAQCLVCMTVGPQQLDMWGRLPRPLALFAVLGIVRPRTINPFLPSFLSWCHSCEKRYQALSPTFLYWKWQKAGRGLETRLGSTNI